MPSLALPRRDDTAASTTSILVFLAALALFAVAVAGLMVGSDQQASSPPDTEFQFQGDTEQLTVTRQHGDEFEAEQVTIEGSATNFDAEEGSVAWADAPNGQSRTVEVGDRITLGTEANERYSLTNGRIKLVWHDDATGETTVIATHQLGSG